MSLAHNDIQHLHQPVTGQLVPFMKFQYNNHVHSTTHQVLFLLDTGWIPWMGFEPRQCCSHLESINRFKDWMKEALDESSQSY